MKLKKIVERDNRHVDESAKKVKWVNMGREKTVGT